MAERRREEIDRLHTKVKDLTTERDEAVNKRCEAQVRLEDVTSKEMNIKFRETRLGEERGFLETQIVMLKVSDDHFVTCCTHKISWVFLSLVLYLLCLNFFNL